MNCNICVEKVKKVVKCYCNFKACQKCYETFILSKNEPAQCMDCHKIFDREFLYDNYKVASRH
jgi:hypothetical protein